MDAVQRDPRGLDTGSRRDLPSQGIVRSVAQFAPIQGAEHVTLPCILDYDPFRQERLLHGADRIARKKRLAERRFVLVPLAEIAPGLVHPILRKTIRALLRDCPDRSAVLPISRFKKRP